MPDCSTIHETETISDEARHVVISLNPKAGRGPSRKLAEQLRDILCTRGYHVHLETDLATVVSLSKEHLKAGTLRCVVGLSLIHI